MGYRATAPITVCLARNPAGTCIQSRSVAVGEFGNQPYVDKVHSYFEYFLRNPVVVTPPPGPTGPGPTGPRPPTKLPETIKPAVPEEREPGSHEVNLPLVIGLGIVLGGLLWVRSQG